MLALRLGTALLPSVVKTIVFFLELPDWSVGAGAAT